MLCVTDPRTLIPLAFASGTRDCLMLLPALAQLQSLTLGLVTVADGGLQRLAIFTSLAELRIPIACSSLVVDILPGNCIQAVPKPAVALLCTSKTLPNSPVSHKWQGCTLLQAC